MGRGQATCSGSFDLISAASFVENLTPGWNLGNSLDAFPDEDSWNNAAVQESVFDDVKEVGFRSVRVPGKLILLRSSWVSCLTAKSLGHIISLGAQMKAIRPTGPLIHPGLKEFRMYSTW